MNKKLFIACTLFMSITSLNAKPKAYLIQNITQQEYDFVNQQLENYLDYLPKNIDLVPYGIQFLENLGTPAAFYALNRLNTMKQFRDQSYALTDSGQYSAAIKICTQAIAYQDNWACIWGSRATCYFLLQNYKSAMSDCSEAIMLYPQEGYYYLLRSQCYFAIGNCHTAINDMNTAAILGNEQALKIIHQWSQVHR